WRGLKVEKSWFTRPSASDGGGTLSGSPLSSASSSPHESSASASRFWPAFTIASAPGSSSDGAGMNPAWSSPSGRTRQKASKQRSNGGTSSRPGTKTARRPRESSGRSAKLGETSARTAAVTSNQVTGRPERRSRAAKRATAADRSRGTRSARRGQERGKPGLGDLGAEPLHVVDVLQHAAERLADERFIDVVGVQRREGLRPVERLGHARHLREAHLAHALHELRDLAREAAVDTRHLAPDDPDLLVGRRIVEPEVETPATERVGQLARAVRRQDDVRRMRRLDRA